MLRNLFALIAGLFAMMIVNTAFAFANMTLYPPPAGVDLRDAAAAQAFLQAMPGWLLGFIVLGWLAMAAVGAWLASRLAQPRSARSCAIFLGLLASVLAAHNASSVSHPAWMLVAGIALPPVIAWYAASFAALPSRRVPGL